MQPSDNEDVLLEIDLFSEANPDSLAFLDDINEDTDSSQLGWMLFEQGIFGQLPGSGATEKSSSGNGRADFVSISITEYDFLEGAEREAFLTLKRQARLLCNVNSHADERIKAMDWMFIPSQQDADGFTLDLCCEALEGRPDLLRIRSHFQFYKMGLLLPEPMPFMAVPAPDAIVNEVMYHVGEDAADMVRLAWMKPSIRVDMLRGEMGMEAVEFTQSLEELLARGYVAVAGGHVYFSGRNPDLLDEVARARFDWSRQIPES